MHFGQAAYQALQGGLTAWKKPLYSRLAMVILLDQFSRNMFRGAARAFDGDARALHLTLHLTLHTLTEQQDRQLPLVGWVFMYMSLMQPKIPRCKPGALPAFRNC